jgi:hypothetical protein
MAWTHHPAELVEREEGNVVGLLTRPPLDDVEDRVEPIRDLQPEARATVRRNGQPEDIANVFMFLARKRRSSPGRSCSSTAACRSR